MTTQKGRVTIPTDEDVVRRTLEIMDRSAGVPLPPDRWRYESGTGCVVIDAPESFHDYTVSFLAYAYPRSGRWCVVNNTYEPQRTTVYTDGGSLTMDLAAGEIRWFDM